MSTTPPLTFLDYANQYENNASSWMQMNITGNRKMPRALRLVKRLRTKFIRGVNRDQNFGCVASKLGNFNKTPKSIKQNVVDPFLEILKKFSNSRCRGWPKYEGILSRIERILQISS